MSKNDIWRRLDRIMTKNVFAQTISEKVFLSRRIHKSCIGQEKFHMYFCVFLTAIAKV